MARRALVRAFVLIVLVSCSPPALHAQPPPESRTPELSVAFLLQDAIARS